MDFNQKTFRKMSITSNSLLEYERIGITPKKDIQPFRSSYKPPQYHFVVAWQMEEDKKQEVRQY